MRPISNSKRRSVARQSSNKAVAMMRLLVCGLAVALVCSCAVATSRRASFSDGMAETRGAYYFLPKAKVHVQLLKAKDKETYALKYIETVIVPDESAVLLLDYERSVLSNDSITIQLTSDGLLKKVETTVEDKSGEVIVKLAEVAKEVAKAAIYVTSVGESPEVIRDFFFSVSEVKRINDEIAKISKANLLVDLVPLATAPAGGKKDVRESSPGVCFRPQMPHMLTFVEGNTILEERPLLLPDSGRGICLPIERAAFVKQVTNLTFDKGILTEVHIEKPSEALGFMQIPLSIAQALASLPAELLQLKINYSNKEKDLDDARRAELQAKQALLDYLKKQQEERERAPL